MNIPLIFWIVPLSSIIALAVAWAFYRSMKREDEGTPRMREIAEHVRKGAMAYLRQQYKVVLIVFIILALFFAYLAYGAGVQNPWVPFAFLTGGFFSGLAGYFGMKTATYASARTANAARQSLDRGLKVAFRSGAVMGLVVVGLGLLDISFWYVILNHFVEVAGPQKLVVITTTMLTFGMGASTQALFARVGGGIYTKAADVGADLVGKVEAGIPEDDPRNPRFEARYREVPDRELPRTESLKDTIERTMPYWKCILFPSLKDYDDLLVVAHGNSLRGIIKHLKGISDAAISELNLPTAVPYVFEFDDKLRLVKDYFLGDPEQIRKLMEAVANQGKK